MSVFEFPKSLSSSPSHDSNPPPSHGNLNIDLSRLSSPGPSDDQPPQAPPLDQGSSKRPYRPSDSGPSMEPYPPSDPRPSTSDPGASTPHPPSNPGPLQHESDFFFSELFRGKFKRRISGSRSVNAAQRELQGTVDSRE
jgi:hypothetical protein